MCMYVYQGVWLCLSRTYWAQRDKAMRKPALTSGGNKDAEIATPITEDVPKRVWGST